LLKSNAENLRESNRMVREEMERGVFDIEAVKAANAELIATIEEACRSPTRASAAAPRPRQEMIKMEAELRDTLAAASARTPTADAAPAPQGPDPETEATS
jgi:uncharacterized protein YaaN involved in tellurite resistance